MENNLKCPHCNGDLFKYQPSQGTHYFLSTIDQTKTPPDINPASGLAITAYGCRKCGSVILKDLRLINL